MRFKVLSCLVVAGATLVVSAELDAQNHWWGVLGGVNRSTVRDLQDVDARWSAVAGLYAAKRFGALEIQPNFLAVWRRAREGGNLDLALNTIDIQVLFGVPFGERVQPMLYVAPVASLCANSEDLASGSGCRVGKTVSFSASAGASVLFGSVVVDLRYTRGLADLAYEGGGKWDTLMLMAGFRLAMGSND